MKVDKNGVELKVGDTVRFDAVVQESAYSAADEVLAAGALGQRFYIRLGSLEFVSRPESTVSVDLTLEEIQSLRTIGNIAGSRAYWKLVAARTELANA